MLIEIASIVVNPNIAIHIGIVRPPPPTPPLLARPNKNGKIIIAIISDFVGGKTFL